MATERSGFITATTKVPRLHRPDGSVVNVQLVAWTNGMVTWEEVDG